MHMAPGMPYRSRAPMVSSSAYRPGGRDTEHGPLRAKRLTDVAPNFSPYPRHRPRAVRLASGKAAVITNTYVGTFANEVFANTSGIVRGGRYVVTTTFDTAGMTLVPQDSRVGQFAVNTERDMYAVALPNGAGQTNSYQVFIPVAAGAGPTANPNQRWLTQTGQSHFFSSVDTPGNSPTAEIQFFSSCNSAATCDAAFRGFQFEGNFIRSNSPTTPASAEDFVFEQFAPDSTQSGGVDVTGQFVNVLKGAAFTPVTLNAGTVDIRSESPSASGGALNPGVFFAKAVDVIAEAGPAPLVYSATQQTVTTNGGTAVVTDTVAPIVTGQLRTAPSSIDVLSRQADNDLGAGRTDKEDFLTHTWTVNGSNLGGNLDATRINRIVETLNVADPNTQPHGNRYVNSGTRTVENVNIAVALVNSGLRTTIDQTSFGLNVTEQFTGKTGSDTVAVRYQNAAVTSADAGPELLFSASALSRTATGSVVDPDLAINSQIAGFETHTFNWSQGGNAIGTNQNQLVTLADAGITTTLATSVLSLTATDRAGTSATDGTPTRYANALPTIDTAQATAQGQDLLFELNIGDLDLGVNTLIPDFEALAIQVLVDAQDQSSFFDVLIRTGSQLVDQATLLAAFGAGSHLFGLRVTDRFLAAGGQAVLGGFTFDVEDQLPLPATWWLIAAGLFALTRTRRTVKR